MTALVLALDPGGTTGYAYGHIRENVLTVAPGESRMPLWELYNLLEIWCRQDFGTYLVNNARRHLIWETYEYRVRSQPGSDPTPLKLIGVIELFQVWHDTEVGMWPQTAAQGHGHYSDQSLKDLGLWFKGKGHGRAATKHLLQWATFGFGATLLHPTGRLYDMITVEQFRDRYIGDVSSRRGRQHAPHV